MKSQNIFNKILSEEDLRKQISSLKDHGKSIVFTNGCFDILHLGHISLLYKCSGFADKLIVGVNSDSSVRRLKGPERPVNNQEARTKTLSCLQFIDYISIFDTDTPLDLITMIKPDFLVKGGDWNEDQIVGADYVKSYGGKVEVIPFIEGFSTTAILDKISDL
jgi:rfaE bifunctional protein nucleotidyltransferase chain/domain